MGVGFAGATFCVCCVLLHAHVMSARRPANSNKVFRVCMKLPDVKFATARADGATSYLRPERGMKARICNASTGALALAFPPLNIAWNRGGP